MVLLRDLPEDSMVRVSAARERFDRPSCLFFIVQIEAAAQRL